MRNLWNLTPAEEKVLFYWKQGLQAKEVAKVLKLKLPTVNKHISNIYDKKGINKKSELFKGTEE